MATNVIMPALGIAMETGKLLQWLKSEGQQVIQGEVLMVIETDKTTVEIEAPVSGVLSAVTAKVGDEVPVGQTIAQILAPGDTTAPIQPVVPVPTVAQKNPEASVADMEVMASPLARRIAEENNLDLRLVKPAGGRIEKADVLAYLEHRTTSLPEHLVPASPKARREAANRNISLASVKGSGPEGAVIYDDVVKTAPTKVEPVKLPSPQPVQEERQGASAPDVIKPGTIWRIMAERTTQSWTTVPHFYLSRDVNAGRLITWRERAQKRFNEKITYTDLLVRLVAAALRQHPRVNSMWKESAIHLLREVNIGLAVAVEDGLVVPVLHRADELSIVQIAQQRAVLVSRAQSSKLKPEDISGGTFTITNLGMYGIDNFHAIVNPPQAAILAIGRIVQRVVPVEERPAVQSMMTLTLSCDHRAVDGARGAQFIQTLAEMIEEPLGLLD